MLRPSPATAMAATAMAGATVAMVDTDTVAAMAVDMVVMAATVATTARGLLMPSLRLSPVTVIVAAMAATDTAGATDTTARGRLRLSPAAATTAMARGLLSPAMATAATAGATVAMAATAMAGAMATGVSYHRIRRSELSQKQ